MENSETENNYICVSKCDQMSAAELKELRKEAKKYLDHADERVVKMVYAMLEADATNEASSNQLTPEQEAELDADIELYEKGLMEFSTWEDVKARITSKMKNAV